MNDRPRSAEHREQVLAVARRLFAAHGYSGTGMRQLAGEAGIGLSMINYYFGSKQGILETIVDDFHGVFIPAIRAALESESTLDGKLRAYVRAAVGVARSRPDDLRICYTELPQEVPGLAAYKAERVARLARLLQEHLLPLLTPERRAGLNPAIFGPAIGSAIVSHFLVRPVLEQLHGPLPDDDAFFDTYADQIARLLLYGLAGEPPAG